ncbi:MAG: phosphodiester glycosidase family protein [Christensenellaceae bacterium]|nr:phosphodiester glycosidase family protein [Christensenellaceae bacterium]
MKKPLNFILIIYMIAFLFFVAMYIPSPEILPEAKNKYMNEIDDFSFKFNDLFISKAIAEGTFGTAEAVLPIPLEETQGRDPIAENFTENSYEDQTIKIKMEHGRFEDCDYHVAYVEIVDPSQLRTGLAGELGSKRVLKTSELAPKFNALVAINGDFYTQVQSGFIVRQGEVYRKKTSSNLDFLLIDSMGDFHIIVRGKEEQVNQIKELIETKEIVNGFCFGPALVIDGQVQQIPENYQFAPHYKNPRAGIAQLGPLKYALVVVDGRLNDSEGLDLTQFSHLMKEIGSVHAYNLDGGNSAALYFKDSLYSTKSVENERSITDIIYFVTAVLN